MTVFFDDLCSFFLVVDCVHFVADMQSLMFEALNLRRSINHAIARASAKI